MKNFSVRSNKQKRTFTLHVDGSIYRTSDNIFSKEEFEERKYYTENDWRTSLHNDDIFIAIK